MAQIRIYNRTLQTIPVLLLQKKEGKDIEVTVFIAAKQTADCEESALSKAARALEAKGYIQFTPVAPVKPQVVKMKTGNGE